MDYKIHLSFRIFVSASNHPKKPKRTNQYSKESQSYPENQDPILRKAIFIIRKTNKLSGLSNYRSIRTHWSNPTCQKFTAPKWAVFLFHLKSEKINDANFQWRRYTSEVYLHQIRITYTSSRYQWICKITNDTIAPFLTACAAAYQNIQQWIVNQMLALLIKSSCVMFLWIQKNISFMNPTKGLHLHNSLSTFIPCLRSLIWVETNINLRTLWKTTLPSR